MIYSHILEVFKTSDLGKITDAISNFFDMFGSGYKYQKIGMCILIAALVFLLMENITICYILLGVTLGFDLYLVKKKEPTITQWWRPKLPKLVDTIITIALAGVFIWLNPVYGLYFLFGTINGHLNGDW